MSRVYSIKDMKELVAVIPLTIFGLGFMAGNAQAVDYPKPSAAQEVWGECTWNLATKLNKADLYRRVVYNKKQSGDYDTWEDFDIDVVTPKCGDMPNIWKSPVGMSYHVLRLTDPEGN